MKGYYGKLEKKTKSSDLYGMSGRRGEEGKNMISGTACRGQGALHMGEERIHPVLEEAITFFSSGEGEGFFCNGFSFTKGD